MSIVCCEAVCSFYLGKTGKLGSCEQDVMCDTGIFRCDTHEKYLPACVGDTFFVSLIKRDSFSVDY